MPKDFHEEEFHKGTLLKLDIFREYLKEWLPVFLAKNSPIWPNVAIYDFFAGPGSDPKGNPGTPLIIKEQLKDYSDHIRDKETEVRVILNEPHGGKIKKLEEEFPPGFNERVQYEVKLEQKDFSSAFSDYYSLMKDSRSANLLLLDQTGIKHIDKDTFREIITLGTTDFLFFISSSTIHRFSENENIRKYINLTEGEVKKKPYHEIHRLILEYYKNLIPSHIDYYLAPFSIKKESNIYGLIFGSGQLFGLEKFLNACWKFDRARGEANFNIDKEHFAEGTGNLFTGELPKAKKREEFEAELEKKIRGREIDSNKDVYEFTLLRGFKPTHAREVLNKLKREGVILNKKFPLSHHCTKDSREYQPIQRPE